VRSKIAAYVAADLIAKLSAFAIIPLLTKNLAPEQFGELSLFLSVIQILIVLFGFSGNGLVAVEYALKGEVAAKTSLKALTHLSLITCVLILVIMLLSSLMVVVPIEYYLVTTIGYCTAASLLLVSYLRSSGKLYLAAIGILIGAIVAQIGSALILYHYNIPQEEIVNVRLFLILLGLATQIVIYSLFMRQDSFGLLQACAMQEYSEVAKYGTTLYIHHFSYWLRSYGDRFLLTATFAMSVVGQYSLAVTVASASVIGFSAVSQALQPTFYKIIKTKGLYRYGFTVLKIVPVIVLALLVYGAVLNIYWVDIFGEVYGESYNIFKFALLPALMQILYQYFSHGVFYLKLNSFISRVSLASTVVYLAFFLVSTTLELGVEGIILSAVIAGAVQLLCVLIKLHGYRRNI